MNRELILDLIAKLRHPMVNENGAHDGRHCQTERDEAAKVLEEILSKGEADGPAR